MNTIKEIIQNKDEILRLKKASIKHTDCFEVGSIETENKAFLYQDEDDQEKSTITRVLALNTYNWMDSHDDVHLEGTFTKTLQENKQKVLHLHDHVYQLTAKVGDVVDVWEQKMQWADLGINSIGETTALLMKSKIKGDYNKIIYSQYLNKQINQHSVGMQYVKIALAVNDPEYKEEFNNWNKYISKVANSQKAYDKGYFWAVTEAKLIEGSCVIAGSNEVTPTFEPTKSIQLEPQLSHEQKAVKYIIENFKL